MTEMRLRLVAATAGGVLGLAGRNVPFAVAAKIVDPREATSCGIEEVLECVVRDSGAVVAGMARLALAAVVVAAISGVGGTIAAAVGLVVRDGVAAALLLGVGLMLMVPAIWLLASFIVFVAT